MALQRQQRAADQQKCHSKDPPVRSLEEVDRWSLGDTGYSVTSVSSKRNTSTVPTLVNFRPRSSISYSEAATSGQQNVNAEVDAGADTPGKFVLDNSPSISLASLELSRNAGIDISPQSYDQEPISGETYSSSLGLQQTLDRSVTSASTEKKRDTYQIPDNLSNSQVKASSNSSSIKTENDSANLRMFLTRPSVQDDDGTVHIS